MSTIKLLLSLGLLSFCRQGIARELQSSDLALKQVIRAENSENTGSLWVPMRNILQSFPFGLSFCASGIDEKLSLSFTPPLASAPTSLIEKSCLVLNYITLQKLTTLTVVTASGDSFQIKLQPQSSLAFHDMSFRVLRTDFDQYITLTFNNKTPASSDSAWLCSNRHNPLTKIASTNITEPVSQIQTYNEYCSILKFLPWNQNYWESYFSFGNDLSVHFYEVF